MVDVLKDNAQNMQDEVQSLWGLMNDVLFHLADIKAEVWDLCLFWAVVQHGQNNLIVVDENNKTVANLEDEQEQLRVEEDNEVEILEEGEVRGEAVFPAGGILVPITNEEEDPQEPSRQVDRAEERVELVRRRLTMDDVAFQEVMETEQAAHVDPVLGYHPAPVYSERSK